jgi:hypothetical protein
LFLPTIGRRSITSKFSITPSYSIDPKFSEAVNISTVSPTRAFTTQYFAACDSSRLKAHK